METSTQPSETPDDGPTPYFAVPFIVLAGLCFVVLMIMFIGTLFMMAGWWPMSITLGDDRYFGTDIMTGVVIRYAVRGVLILWPILSALAIVGEYQDRKRRAAAA